MQKMNGSPLSFGSLRAAFVDPTQAGGSALTSFTNASPSVFTSYQLSVSKYQNYKNCAPMMVVRTDGNGAAIGAPSADVVTVSADFTVGWYSDSLCTVGTSTIGFPIGESAGLVYMKPLDLNVSNGTISVTNGLNLAVPLEFSWSHNFSRRSIFIPSPFLFLFFI
jgi:hypothetical protein